MINTVLIELHPMIGADLHEETGTAVPPKVPLYPHFVTAPLHWVFKPSYAPKVRALHLGTMQRGTDMQSFIPHIPIPFMPYCLSVPQIVLFSGSKSHFGVARVKVAGSPVAVALLCFININLNCGDIPLPNGYVIAPNTVLSGLTWADFFGGLFAMMCDLIVQTAFNEIMGNCGIKNPFAAGLVGALIGSPLGFSFNGGGTGLVGLGGRTWGNLSDVARGLGEYLGGDFDTGYSTIHSAADKLENDGITAPPEAGALVAPGLPGEKVPGQGWIEPKNADWTSSPAVQDAETIFDRPIQKIDEIGKALGPGPSPTSAAFDNPAAEAF